MTVPPGPWLASYHPAVVSKVLPAAATKHENAFQAVNAVPCKYGSQAGRTGTMITY